MTIPYTLDTNKLTKDGEHFARVRSVGTAGLDMLANPIVGRGSTAGRADALPLGTREVLCLL